MLTVSKKRKMRDKTVFRLRQQQENNKGIKTNKKEGTHEHQDN